MRRTSHPSSRQTTPRHVWLAALGAASIARRQALAAIEQGLSQSARLRSDAIQAAIDARNIARGAAMTLEEKVQPQVERVGKRLLALLSPLFEPRAARPDANKPKARKPARKTRPVARAKTTPRSAGARKQAATRIARKGRV